MILGPNFVFLCTPRCASNTLREWLVGLGCQHVEPHHGYRVPLHMRWRTIYAIVRNPYDRMLSMWYHTRRNSPSATWQNMGPVEFAHNCHRTEYGMNQSRFLKFVPGCKVFHYERLDELTMLGEKFPVERCNAEDRPLWEQDPALTHEFIAAVNLHSDADFVLFDYRRLT